MWHEGDHIVHGLLLAPNDYISVVPTFRETLTGASSEGQEDLEYRSVSSFDEGVEGGYLVEAHHLPTQLHEGPSA